MHASLIPRYKVLGVHFLEKFCYLDEVHMPRASKLVKAGVDLHSWSKVVTTYYCRTRTKICLQGLKICTR